MFRNLLSETTVCSPAIQETLLQWTAAAKQRAAFAILTLGDHYFLEEGRWAKDCLESRERSEAFGGFCSRRGGRLRIFHAVWKVLQLGGRAEMFARLPPDNQKAAAFYMTNARHGERGYNPGNHPATAFRLANLGRRREEGGELNSDESQS